MVSPPIFEVLRSEQGGQSDAEDDNAGLKAMYSLMSSSKVSSCVKCGRKLARCDDACPYVKGGARDEGPNTISMHLVTEAASNQSQIQVMTNLAIPTWGEYS